MLPRRYPEEFLVNQDSRMALQDKEQPCVHSCKQIAFGSLFLSRGSFCCPSLSSPALEVAILAALRMQLWGEQTVSGKAWCNPCVHTGHVLA